MPVTANRTCPNCHAVLAPSQRNACSKCGFSLAAGVVRRDTPAETRGLEGIAKKFGATWSFAIAALAVIVSYICFNDMSTAEETGGSFSAIHFPG
jgi:hypothetical protein